MAKKSEMEQEINDSYPKLVDRRLGQIRFILDEHKIEGIVVNYLPNIRYLTNFSGSSALLLILEDQLHFITDDRYEEQIETELYNLPGLHKHITRTPWEHISESDILNGINNLGFEADRIAYSEAVDIRNKVRPVKFKPTPSAVEPFTMQKAPEEIENISKACKMAEKVYDIIVEWIKPGITEKDLATEIAYLTRKLGSEGDPFDIIAVSGERSSLVHGQPSLKKIKKNDIILLDFGCKVNGFCSDISRTFVLGKATKEQQLAYKVLREAKDEAILNARPGTNGKILDNIARSRIEKAGMQPYRHSLGHGLGIVVHERPTIRYTLEDQIIPEDGVVAIEPGVYFPGKWGMRVEDNIQVSKNGSIYLTKAPEELPVI